MIGAQLAGSDLRAGTLYLTLPWGVYASRARATSTLPQGGNGLGVCCPLPRLAGSRDRGLLPLLMDSAQCAPRRTPNRLTFGQILRRGYTRRRHRVRSAAKMVDYLPKSTAPVAFNAIDAIISAIHNDPVWGWLEGYAHLYPNQYVDTATFCSQGPRDAPAIGLGDLLNLAPLGTPEWFAAQQKIALRIEGILHDRLFGAMCASPAPAPVGGWCPSEFVTVPGTQALGADGAFQTWQAPPGNTSVHVRLLSKVGTGLDARVDDGYTYPPWVGRGTVGGYNDSSGAPSSWSTWALAGGEWLRFLRYAGGDHTYEIQPNACRPGAFDPTPQPQPTGFTPRVIPPTAAVADLGPILFAIELKLEELLRVDRQVAQDSLPNPDDAATPIDVVPDEEIDATNWRGCVITVSSVPPAVDVGFGDPPQYVGLGRINLGTPLGWFPAIPITSSPMVIRPMPPTVTRVTVTVRPPATATVAPILLLP